MSHRNRSLILNNTTNKPYSGDATSGPKDNSEDSSTNDNSSGQLASAKGWIAKHDRHRQLINPAVYDREMMSRTRDLETTRKLKAQQRNEQQKLRFTKHLQNLARIKAAQSSRITSATPALPAPEIDIQGARYKVTNGGSRLVKILGIWTLWLFFSP